VRLVDDRLHLVIGELLGADRVAVREDPAGGADLDDLGAIFVEPADLGPSLLGAVDDVDLLAVVGGRKLALVAMAAGGADRIAGGDDPRPLDPAAVDRLAEADVLEAVGADVADRGEAGAQRLLPALATPTAPQKLSVYSKPR
jgi:hypothetical protein